MQYVNQRRGRTFIAGLFLLLMLAGLFVATHGSETTDRTTSRTNWLSFGWGTGTITEHPITKLIADAKATFTDRLAKQSKTLSQAVAEYKRRYGRDPPRGFDHWWEFAKEHDFKLVDEFDAVVEDLAPFWTLSGEELRRRAFQVGLICSARLGSDLTALTTLTDGALALNRPRTHQGR